MESTVTHLDRQIAERLRGLRLEHGLSLENLAAMSGLSRATLSRLENSQVSPTASTLGRLCAAFGLTMSRLLAMAEQADEAVVPAEAQTLWTDPASGFRRRSVSASGGGFECELVEGDLPAGARIAYEASPRPGLEHHLYLQAGELAVTVGGRRHELHPGDSLRYRLFGPSAFETAVGARYILAIR